MGISQVTAPLSRLLPPLVLGGAGFSHQIIKNPNASQARKVLERAFQLGLRAIDTSAYYHPSEILLGEALSHPEISSHYSRDQYLLMTKAGRISVNHFDYSPAWIRKSVLRSLERLRTEYLDVVFCHDVEFVPESEVVEAVGVLIDLVHEGHVRYIGISGYRIDILSRLAHHVREKYDRPLDIIQNWAQLTLQNDVLARDGLAFFRSAGISCVCSSSPLAIGLLRDEGVPVGDLARGESLAALALRYAIRRAQLESSDSFRVTTIMGITSVAELEENLAVARQVLPDSNEPNLLWATGPAGREKLDSEQSKQDEKLAREIQDILGPWKNYSFPSPGDGWDVTRKQPAGTKL
ncbi:hypothetical protein N7468_001840 [Penicillium chermesinum]|uniref:NADP-dependent oxidoreductase domain-containing protein n=1 Tax=Penicillium chermesinum TaxID=63820 RepID=A0A9W9PIN4_9EURO|nr:uncharacterized protein N7468_001840 [Penicillium chermesinum]KAJ5246857.1 hypothetical protein N7468_001840 [Penicillium chermesinum]